MLAASSSLICEPRMRRFSAISLPALYATYANA